MPRYPGPAFAGPSTCLIRASILFKTMDCRVKPGNDEHCQNALNVMIVRVS